LYKQFLEWKWIFLSCINITMSDAMAESLNCASQKRRAVASRSYRVKVSPVNGQNFTAGQTVNIDLPSNLAATYVNNWNQCYLKFKVTPTGNPLTIDKAASCFISRVQSMTAGAQIFDCPSWNVLMNVLLDSDSGPAYKAGYGNILMGTQGSNPAGEVLTAGNARVFCVPFTLHPFGMSTPHRLMPLSSSAPVQFKLTLASIQEAGYAATAPTALTFEEVELVCVFTELSAGAEQQVMQMNGGQFNILANSWQAISTSMETASTAVTSNVGISVSSLERVLVVHRPNTSLTGQAYYSQSNRITNGLSEWSLLINGEQYPQRPIKVEGAGAECIAEYLLSDHSLVNFDKQSSFNVAVAFDTASYNGLDATSVGKVAPTPYTLAAASATGASPGTALAAGNIGSFFAGLELEGLELETGLSDGRSQRLYSGISTISSTVNFRGIYAGGASTVASEITFFLGYTVLLSLNARGTNVWSISV
jgi:hypothetical protein